jgi:hypothetical protein
VKKVLIGMQAFEVIKTIALLVIYHALFATFMKNAEDLLNFSSWTSM